jgi:hypothetical protein
MNISDLDARSKLEMRSVLQGDLVFMHEHS